MKFFKYFVVCLMPIITFSCTSDEEKVVDQFAVDIKLIDDYIKANSLDAIKTPQGVYYVVDTIGGAEKPLITNQVTANYKGYFLDGVVFDSGTNVVFDLFGVIPGWQIGIPKFGKGGKGKLLIPSKLGYGTSDVNGRTNAVLIFDIELIDFK